MQKIQAKFSEKGVLTEPTDQARDLFNKRKFGSIKKSNVLLSLFESFYLLEKGVLNITKNNKKITEDSFLKLAKKSIKEFQIKYVVFRDLRDRGYIVKTALKFGAEFRVYDKGISPGQDHSKWIVYPVHESDVLTWHDFAAKNRVAHSTKKRLLIAIVDEEEDITYYEVNWKRP